MITVVDVLPDQVRVLDAGYRLNLVRVYEDQFGLPDRLITVAIEDAFGWTVRLGVVDGRPVWQRVADKAAARRMLIGVGFGAVHP